MIFIKKWFSIPVVDSTTDARGEPHFKPATLHPVDVNLAKEWLHEHFYDPEMVQDLTDKEIRTLAAEKLATRSMEEAEAASVYAANLRDLKKAIGTI